MVDPADLRRFHSGILDDAYRVLGAHCLQREGRHGVRFVTWAPHAARVSVVGDFNQWDGRRHPMERLDRRGMWGLFVPGLGPGTQYKFEIENAENGRLVIKTDPYARAFAAPSNTNALVAGPSRYRWRDAAWLARRAAWDWQRSPLLIYEVHLGSWCRPADGSRLPYAVLAAGLTDYARRLHDTHLELLPVFEHPLEESLGYQVTGYFAPTSRFGTPDDFRAFVDHCHAEGVGVIVDWVPLHFPKDEWALAEFDGAALYERDDPSMAEHPQWQTLIFNYGRPEVRTFLLSNALYWLREFHVDGLRVDAVSSMLYLDDGRVGRAFRPNPLGGRENLPAVRFLREMTALCARSVPGTLTIAEESTSWPAVSRPPERGGLGFSMRWNMGWVHDTLSYLGLPWSERPRNHHKLTFERMYGAGERFVLALSHDEVAAGRGALVEQMYGTWEERLAQVRLLMLYLAAYPGKKLHFMGVECGQPQAWDPTSEVDWNAAASPQHEGIRRLVCDLNALVASNPALHAGDFEGDGFGWLEPNDAGHCVLAFARRGGGVTALAVLNFSPRRVAQYRLGAPQADGWELAVSSDAAAYGGDAATALLTPDAEDIAWQGYPHSVRLQLGSLAGAIVTVGSRGSPKAYGSHARPGPI